MLEKNSILFNLICMSIVDIEEFKNITGKDISNLKIIVKDKEIDPNILNKQIENQIQFKEKTVNDILENTIKQLKGIGFNVE